MGYNLVIDQGNSTAKVALFEGDMVAAHARFERLGSDELKDFIGERRVDAAIYCSVTQHGEDIVVTLRSIAARVYELTSMLPLPVSIAYTTPTTLGRDRIAAVAGAYALHGGRTVLVVDAGTAITYDRLTPDGEFSGGNIAPGLWMRAEALRSMTSRLPYVDVETAGEVQLWGTDTVNAIKAGVVRGAVGEIMYYRSLLPDDTLVLLTGGDAPRLAPLLDCAAEVDPMLVSKGLNSILIYNENL